MTLTRYLILGFVLAAGFVFVLVNQEGEPDPQDIVDRAIAVHGGAHLEHAVVEFDFRDAHFKVTRDGGLFSYERTFADSIGVVRDVLNNDSLYRTVDGQYAALSERTRLSAEEAVNSVVYFALLPFPLNDPAVQKRYLGADTLEGQPYHAVEITFRKEGGGRDYQDRFVYWFHQDRSTMDYLAYYYYTSEQGSRLRKAINPRMVGGVRFADYLNFENDSVGTAVENYAALIASESLTLVSTIEIENITVRPLPG